MSSFRIARQPILDSALQVQAYELFFRPPGELQSCVDDENATLASSRVLLSSFVDGGGDDVVDGKPAFINVSAEFLQRGIASMLPRESVALELAPAPDGAFSGPVLRELTESGYEVILDQFKLADRNRRFVEICPRVKLDVSDRSEEALASEVEAIFALGRCAGRQVELFASRIESREVFERCKSLGFIGFQGYFLCRPVIVASREIPGPRMGILRTLAQVSRTDVDMRELENIIRQDVTLTYRLLRIANSSFYSRGSSASTIRAALTRLGVTGTREWISLLAMSQIDGKPNELVVIAMIRAKFCEELARRSGRFEPDRSFLVGLLSMVDAIMDQPLERLLELLAVDEELSRALLRQHGELGRALRCAMAQERGDFAGAQLPELDRQEVQDAYLAAIRWTREMGALA